jgi:hypothetical protein
VNDFVAFVKNVSEMDGIMSSAFLRLAGNPVESQKTWNPRWSSESKTLLVTIPWDLGGNYKDIEEICSRFIVINLFQTPWQSLDYQTIVLEIVQAISPRAVRAWTRHGENLSSDITVAAGSSFSLSQNL